MSQNETSALKAIGAVLLRIRNHAITGYYNGPFSETFALLTQAYAELTGKPIAEIEEVARPRGQFHAASSLIEWHYVKDGLPDDDITVLVAGDATANDVSAAFHSDGQWKTMDGAHVMLGIYAWADMPSEPPPHKGGAS